MAESKILSEPQVPAPLPSNGHRFVQLKYAGDLTLPSGDGKPFSVETAPVYARDSGPLKNALGYMAKRGMTVEIVDASDEWKRRAAHVSALAAL